MRIQVRDGNPLYIGNEDFQRVDNFSYLGSVVSVTGGTEEEIIAHIRKDQQAFACLSAVWKATSLSLETKIRVFSCKESRKIKAVLAANRNQRAGEHREDMKFGREDHDKQSPVEVLCLMRGKGD